MKSGRRQQPRLVPLGAHTKPDLRALARLIQAWAFVVGPALADRTRPLRVQHDVLVLGCWELARIAPLREAVTAVWPQVRARIHRALNLNLSGLQVIPCDPPEATEAVPRDSDRLRAALRLLELRRNERIRLGLETE